MYYRKCPCQWQIKNQTCDKVKKFSVKPGRVKGITMRYSLLSHIDIYLWRFWQRHRDSLKDFRVKSLSDNSAQKEIWTSAIRWFKRHRRFNATNFKSSMSKHLQQDWQPRALQSWSPLSHLVLPPQFLHTIAEDLFQKSVFHLSGMHLTDLLAISCWKQYYSS